MGNAAKKQPANVVVPIRDIRTRTEDVTPEKAKAWLEKNIINRAISPATVEQYAYDMKMGRWELTGGDSIEFDEDGNLVNGQHRLHAVIVAGISVKMRVSYNCASIWAVRDRGRPRRVGDFLQWSDGEIVEDSQRIVSWMGAIELMRTHTRLKHNVGRCRELLAQNEPSFRWLVEKAPTFMRAPICGAFVYAWPVAKEKTNEFVEAYISGADLHEGSPVLSLRNRTTVNHERRAEERIATSYQALNALRAFIRGRAVDRIAKSDAGYIFFKELRERKGL